MKPNFRIAVGGQVVLATGNPAFVSLRVSDQAGRESDSVSVTLSNVARQIVRPPRGASLDVAIGWAGQKLVPCGSFTVDQVTRTVAPETLQITGRAANLRGPLRERKTRSFEGRRLDEIANAIAAESGLGFTCTAKARALIAEATPDTCQHQDNESSLNFLSRLADETDCTFSVKGGKILLNAPGEELPAASGSGGPALGTIDVTDVQPGFSFATVDRGAYAEVKAKYYDKEAGEYVEVVADSDEEDEDDTAGADADANENPPHREGSLTLPKTYPDEASALAAAKAARAKGQRESRTCRGVVSVGRPSLTADGIVTLTGFGMGDDGRYRLKSVEHSIDSSAFTTSIEGERL